MYTVTIEEAQPLTLAAIRHRGPYTAIGSAFECLAAWAGPRGLMTPQTRAIGLYFDDPGQVPESELRSAACLSVPEPVTDAEAGVETFRIPGGPCATLRHVGPYSDLGTPYAWLYGTWLPQSGREPADQPSYEDYLNDPSTTPPDELVTVIHVPLKPQDAGA